MGTMRPMRGSERSQRTRQESSWTTELTKPSQGVERYTRPKVRGRSHLYAVYLSVKYPKPLVAQLTKTNVVFTKDTLFRSYRINGTAERRIKTVIELCLMPIPNL